MKIGVVGAGQFSSSFIPLFQAHPYVSDVYLAELIPERLARVAQKYGISQTYASFDDLLESDVDAIAIFTQRHLHGPQTLAALNRGKHVYCAVPISHRLDEIAEIVEKVKQTGLTYMTGETSYYYPCTVYCRERFRRGDFGEFVYGEAQYYHDMSHGFYDAFKYSGGADWKQVAGFPPMFYPTHSTSMILSVTGARIKKASCMGFADHHEDGIFQTGANLWDNRFSNESALMRTSFWQMILSRLCISVNSRPTMSGPRPDTLLQAWSLMNLPKKTASCSMSRILANHRLTWRCWSRIS